MREREIDRRRFLYGLAAAGASVAGAATLISCGGGGAGSTPSGGSGGGGRGLQLPTYQRAEAVAPDLLGDQNGLPDGYYSYPHPAQPLIETPPGKGGAVTAMFGITLAAPPPMGQNQWWQGLNERLGVEFEANMTPYGDYPAKLQTALAGGDLPDLVVINGVPRLPDVLAAEFEDLTEHLSGDAVLDYPFLANLSSVAWRNTIFNGSIYAVPPSNLVGSPTWITRQDIIDGLGLDPAPENADEVFDLFVALTDEGSSRWAAATPWTFTDYFAGAMFDIPNAWAVDDAGAFTIMFETPEYRESLELTARLWAAGAFHPDSFRSANPEELFKAGSIVFHSQGGTGYRNIVSQNIPGLEIGFFTPPLAEGGGPSAKRLSGGNFNICAIRKQESKDRVRELLSILNFFAAPFGSAEHLYRLFGEEGVHHTWDDQQNVPVGTDQLSERLTVGYLASAPYELFDPGHREVTEAMYEHQVATIPEGRQSAILGLYSDTNDRQGQTLIGELLAVRGDVIQGRKSLDDWDAAVERWKSGGGDKIREEFEQANSELEVS